MRDGGGAEGGVGQDGATAGRARRAGRRWSDGVAFDGEVDVEGGASEEEVAEGAADEVEGRIMRRRRCARSSSTRRAGGQRGGEFIDELSGFS